jgi:hypothetical protein
MVVDISPSCKDLEHVEAQQLNVLYELESSPYRHEEASKCMNE